MTLYKLSISYENVHFQKALTTPCPARAGGFARGLAQPLAAFGAYRFLGGLMAAGAATLAGAGTRVTSQGGAGRRMASFAF
jgi:hypothetical protein